MVPWAIAVLTLIPLYKMIYLYTRDLPRENFFSYFHFSGDVLINQGWLWFLPVLFLFDVLYFVLWKVMPARLRFSIKGAVSAVFIIGFTYSFCMSIFHYTGWTKTLLLDFQNERLLIYFFMFLLGSLCYKHDVFSTGGRKRKLFYLLCFTFWIPMDVYIIFLINLVFHPGSYIISGMIDLALFWLGFHLSMLGLLYILINAFRYFLNIKGKLLFQLSTYSYGVYIIHFIAMGVVAAILLNASISSLAKYAVLIVSTYVISNLAVSLYKGVVQMVGQ